MPPNRFSETDIYAVYKYFYTISISLAAETVQALDLVLESILKFHIWSKYPKHPV